MFVPGLEGNALRVVVVTPTTFDPNNSTLPPGMWRTAGVIVSMFETAGGRALDKSQRNHLALMAIQIGLAINCASKHHADFVMNSIRNSPAAEHFAIGCVELPKPAESLGGQ